MGGSVQKMIYLMHPERNAEDELFDLFGDGEVSQHSWVMRIRGVSYIRSELIGVYSV